MTSFILNIDPVPASRPRFTRSGHAYTAEPYRTFKDDLREMVAQQQGSAVPYDRPVRVTITVVCARPKTTKLPHPKPDVDNYAKAVLDAMNGIAFSDDSLVWSLSVDKRWGDEGKILVSID